METDTSNLIKWTERRERLFLSGWVSDARGEKWKNPTRYPGIEMKRLYIESLDEDLFRMITDPYDKECSRAIIEKKADERRRRMVRRITRQAWQYAAATLLGAVSMGIILGIMILFAWFLGYVMLNSDLFQAIIWFVIISLCGIGAVLMIESFRSHMFDRKGH